ncbi:hypothetical protein CEXT_244971 [Caerostris extrusa]|uniref:Uncharacterized protein n=1 Tax=Caerostris extrusa TaxID=172846 RepID=A0AAV4V3N0_CAEEX|nr:hypothetical protein CEXT_244971 [Caerostris extrusa]
MEDKDKHCREKRFNKMRVLRRKESEVQRSQEPSNDLIVKNEKRSLRGPERGGSGTEIRASGRGLLPRSK